MGLVFNIQRFSINDGPGIRTTVFLKGCGLSCKWCHNPESNNFNRELLYTDGLCLMCGKCVEACNNKAHAFSDGKHVVFREKCILCGKCEELCPAEAVEISGKEMTVDEVLEKVLRDSEFYKNSGGGMTLSGGEPLHQFDFSYELMKAAKKNGVHTCIETSGYADTKKLLEISRYTDLFLYDWKITDEKKHLEYTGVSNEKIRENLFALDKAGKDIVLRCPIIPSVNDNEGHFDGIAEIASSLANIKGIDIEPYHSLGISKLARLGRAAEGIFSVPDAEMSESFVKLIRKKTDVPVKLG